LLTDVVVFQAIAIATTTLHPLAVMASVMNEADAERMIATDAY
jgi:hypothetical protein